MTGSSNNNFQKRALSPAAEERTKRIRVNSVNNRSGGEDVSAFTPSALYMALGPPATISALSQDRDYNPHATAGMIPFSPYGQTYQHSSAYISPNMTPAQPSPPRCGLKIGTLPFEQVNLKMPPNLTQEEQNMRKIKWKNELRHQETNPPALPPSQISALPPKEMVEEYLEITDSISEAEKVWRREHNNRVSAEIQRIERERNNQAAKKSRETRLESLKVTREMLDEKAAECAWMRLKVIELGGSTDEWDAVSPADKVRMVEVIHERVKEADLQRAEDKRKEEAHRRTERTRRRAEQKERGRGKPSSSSPPVSRSDATTALSPILDVSSDFMPRGL